MLRNSGWRVRETKRFYWQVLSSLWVCVGLAGCGPNGIQLPQIGESSLKKAVDLYLAAQYDAAEVQADKAVKEGKEYGFAQTILSDTLSAQGKFAQAEVSGREAVRYEPRVANSHAALARALNGMGNFHEAETEARQAIELPEATATPSSRAGQRSLLAFAMQLQGKIPEAEKEYKAAIEADPNFGPTYSAYGALLNFLGRFKEAQPLLDKAVKLMPKDTGCLTQYVICLINVNELDEAYKYNQQLALLLPKDPNVSVMQAEILFKQNNFTGAEDEANKALKMNVLYGPAYTVLAAALHKQGKLKAAEGAAFKATQLLPADALSQLVLARILADENKWLQSGFCLQAAAQLAPFNKALQADIRTLGMRIWAHVPHPPVKGAKGKH